MLAYPTSSSAYPTLAISMPTPSAEAVGVCIEYSSSSCLGKAMSPS